MFGEFVEKCREISKRNDIRNVNGIMLKMLEIVREHIEETTPDEQDDDWVPIIPILGSAMIPAGAAEVLKKAVAQFLDLGEVGERNKWQILEYLAADYLAG